MKTKGKTKLEDLEVKKIDAVDIGDKSFSSAR